MFSSAFVSSLTCETSTVFHFPYFTELSCCKPNGSTNLVSKKQNELSDFNLTLACACLKHVATCSFAASYNLEV